MRRRGFLQSILWLVGLARGQTGLSIAFDLPTQCGYSSDHPLVAPEIGRVGVPINTLDDMALLFEQIPIDQINTSMTINATAMWLLALYVALAEERGIDAATLEGTTQNDIVKEYLARGTYIFPPEPSLRLTVVSPHSYATYSGMVPGVLAGQYRLREAQIDVRALAARAGATFLADRVVRVDAQQRQIHLTDRPPLSYDLLSLDIGSQPSLADRVAEGAPHQVALPASRISGFDPRLVDVVDGEFAIVAVE